MTELAKTDTAPPAQPKEQIHASREIAGMVPKTLDEAYRLSQALSRAGQMVPQHFQGSPDMIMAAVLRGAEVGLAPMQALSSIAVINGRATLWGDAIPALMQRAGHHVDVEIEGEGEKAVAIATLKRGDTGKTIVRRFSMADAKQAGLAGKKGPWQDYPTRMLMHRARSWAVRDGAADALMGLQVSEEVQDYQGPDNARDVTPRRPRGGGFTLAEEAPAPADPAPEGEKSPVVDEILEGETYDAPDLPEEFVGVFDRICGDLNAAETPLAVAKIIETFATEIDAIRTASPAHGAEIDGAAEKARAA